HVDSDYNFSLLNKPTDINGTKIDIDDFLNLTNDDSEKRINKILILYPNVKEKVYYKNNVESRFIYSELEFKGVRIINHKELNEYLKNSEV
ncbi:MAG: hypothetical protein K6G28_01185, partial [Acholeplasmatales bacterium]|nr:hypothetical protein [Acholeplasmatales bacterium]